MSATPAGRYETADELREDVVHFLAGSRVRAYEDTIYDKALRFVSRHRMPIALIATYLLFRILLIVFRGI